MAYKPPKQTIVDNDLKYAPSNEAVFEALKLKLDEPTVTGTNGQLLQLTGYVGGEATTSWVNPPSALPSQSGNLDKVLVTDGTNASWQYAGLGAGSLGTGNVIVGRSKPASITSANNVIIGPSTTANAISTGSENTLIGTDAASTLSTGNYNVAVGYAALASSNSSSCVAIGLRALEGTVGSNNVGIGQSGGYNLGARNNSIYIGVSTGDANSGFGTGDNRIAIGNGALVAANSMAVGGPNSPINKIVFGKGQFDVSTTAGMANTNVTITTTSPRTGWTNVNASAGTITISPAQGTGNGPGGDFIVSTAPAGASGSSLNAHVERMRINSAGNVGIGTSSPSTLLNLAGAWVTSNGQLRITGTSTLAGLTLYHSTTPTSMLFSHGDSSMVRLIARENYGVNFFTNSNGDTNERMRIDSAGNVGIGTTTPAEKLEVNGTVQATRLNLTGAWVTGNGQLRITGTGSLAGLTLYHSNTPTGALYSYDSTVRLMARENYGITFFTNSNLDSNERMRITSDGNVGIGTSTPQEKLDVGTGNARVSNGDLILNTAGNGLKIKTGTNATAGLATITNGTSEVTVTTNKCSATSIIIVTNNTSTAYVSVTNKGSGSFKIAHANNVTGDQECAWFIINPA